MLIRMRYLLFLFVILSLSCAEKRSSFEVQNFSALSNLPSQEGNVHFISLDYQSAIDSGFVIPTVRQTAGGAFQMEFSIRNNHSQAKEFFYTLYYQNETYKFEEVSSSSLLSIQNARASENFYGSWTNAQKGFVSTGKISADHQFHLIKNYFSIVGNPRDEKQYYGTIADGTPLSEKDIEDIRKNISNTPEWSESIRKKSAENGNSYEKQLRLDAMYTLKEERKKHVFNQRWKRNPRVGNYKFLLVVTEKENLTQNLIPTYIQNISKKKDNKFVNPFYYFLYGPGKDQANVSVNISDDILKVIAKPDLGKGIYIDSMDSPRNTGSYNSNCSNSYTQYENADFQQFFHHVNQKAHFNNIPLQADVNGDGYTQEEYRQNKLAFDKKAKIQVPITVSCCPCKTVQSDSINHKITITNPGNARGEWAKENVGMMSRHGFTYGKYRVKVKLASLLNKSLVWNGLTNAIWLIYQSDDAWNARSVSNSGYIPKNLSGENAKKVTKTNYSEIDFEILKTSRHWPATSYGPHVQAPHDLPADSDKIIVTCTNWDLACRDAANFGIGVKPITYKNQNFDLHRWDHWYQALTSKHPEKDSELFDSPYYYFEIEWKPTEIIWRIGPEKNKMHIVGYMNDDVTKIPDNQMLMIISQEYHLAPWWPGSPFSQDAIPFPSKDISGQVFDMEIE